MADDPRTDAQLLAATPREPEAFGVFYRRHAGWVLGYLARRTATREIAADLTAESFAAALIALPRYDERRGAPAAWLFGIVTHQLGRHRRRGDVERRAQRRLGMAHVAAPDDLRIDDAGAVDALLAALPADQRAAVRERVLEDRAYDDIAVELGVSEPVVRQRVSRGLRALRRHLGTESGAGER